MATKDYIADKPMQIDTNAKVTTINNNVGSNSDPSSASGSVHAKLKELRSYLSPATTVNSINSNVGSNADTASPTGSVHAKLKDIKNAIVAGGSEGVTSIYTHTSVLNNTTFQDVVNISGKGVLVSVFQRLFRQTTGTGGPGFIEILIDGIKVAEIQLTDTGVTHTSLPMFISFSNSLILRHRSSESTFRSETYAVVTLK